MIVFGALAIGRALMLGTFVGLAAFDGALLKWNFIMAGTASPNTVRFTLAIWWSLAWKVASGYSWARFLRARIGPSWT